jgi:hypothetical protein
MNRPNTAREVLVAEVLGEVAHLLERVEALTPAMRDATQAMTHASDELGGRLGAFEDRMTVIAENAKTVVLEHIVRRGNELTRHMLAEQSQAMSTAARTLFNTEFGASQHRLAALLQPVAERLQRPWDSWLTHAATAATASAATWAVDYFWLIR